jgi:protein-S-isoprenylcysteine O-methyltransferase Ste14
MSEQAIHPNDRTGGSAVSRLPALGRRGGGWVALQMVLFAVAVVAGISGPPWPPAWRMWLAPAGASLALAGLLLLVGGGRRLGRQLTAYPLPSATGGLRRDGVYRLVRHPMYGGVALVLLAWAVVSSPLAVAAWALAVAFLDAKRRREEAWLLERHAEYAAYRRQVSKRLVPFVW